MSRHEKKGQTGLLDTFFSRPKKSMKNHNNNNNVVSNRPVSSGDTSEAAPDFINRLAEKEVNDRFLELLDDMNIPKDKRGPLLQKGIEERRKMLLMHVKGEWGIEMSRRGIRGDSEGDGGPNKTSSQTYVDLRMLVRRFLLPAADGDLRSSPEDDMICMVVSIWWSLK